MQHKHSVYDTDSHFVVNPITRAIRAIPVGKTTVVQFDHNSERVTFELPRYVEEHDMSLCDKVEVHYINLGISPSEKATGVYEVDDLQVSPEDENIVIFSWLISGNATQYAGQLSFLVRFCCMTDDAVDYAWNTAVCSDFNVAKGLYASDSVVAEYSDVLERWKASLFAAGYINAEDMQNDIATLTAGLATEKGRIDLLSNYVTPEMFGAVGDGVTDDYEALAACFVYAQDKSFNVVLGSRVYCTSKPLTISLTNIIYGNNGVLKATANMDAVLTINKLNEMLTPEKYNGCSAIYDLNVDGNSLASTGIFVKYGKGITLKNIRIKAATNAQMQVSDTDQQVWELIADNVELRSEYEDGYSPYGLLVIGDNTDSYFKNILVINSATAWIDCSSAACNFENIHGYGYPVELAADTGFVFRGNGNFIKGISVDTPMNKGIVVDGDYNNFSDISVGNMQSETGRGIEVNGNANTFDGVRCSTYYCFYITSDKNTVDEFKCLRLFSRSEYDYFFTGKLPYRGVFDIKTEVANNIRRNFVFNNQWFYQSVLTMAVEFVNEFRYNNYNVRLVGVEESAPNYSLVKTTTGCTITCTDAITSGKKVNVIIESPSVTLV